MSKNKKRITADIISYSARKMQAEFYAALHNIKMARLHNLKLRQVFGGDPILFNIADNLNAVEYRLLTDIRDFENVGVVYGL